MELQPRPPTREYTMESQGVKNPPTIRQRVADFLRRIFRSGTGDTSESDYVWNAIRTAVENDPEMPTFAKSDFLSGYALISQQYRVRPWDVFFSWYALLYRLYRFRQKRYGRFAEIPQLALLYLLSQEPEWNVPLKICAHRKAPPIIPEIFRLPSDAQDLHVLPHTILTRVTWSSDVPAYKDETGLSNPPGRHYISMFILDQKAPRDIRAICLAESRESFMALREEYQAAKSQVPFWSAPNELATLFYAIHLAALARTFNCLKEWSYQLDSLAPKARAKPSTKKLQYLNRLGDCAADAELCMSGNISQLANMIQYLTSMTGGSSSLPYDLTRLESLKLDIEYVLSKLKDLAERITKLRGEIEFRVNMASDRTTLLTFLASIYVPVAFVTSFMGMNLTPGLWQGNPASTQDNSSPHLWDLKLFIEISVPLVLATIILPTILGPSGLRNAIARAKRRWSGLLIMTIAFSVLVSLAIMSDSIGSRLYFLLIAAIPLICFVPLFFYN
ncbi:hypothetical protein JMJ35_007159 [Cladonia borealis]|uniref:Uncharacterized protein n=1 Tax=Cladonia borealis TaxID=184061 RepID=A0AA39QWV0_9LECA|nr:hypothetical protein JMJ35_007159 [Cladonia borealis]